MLHLMSVSTPRIARNTQLSYDRRERIALQAHACLSPTEQERVSPYALLVQRRPRLHPTRVCPRLVRLRSQAPHKSL